MTESQKTITAQTLADFPEARSVAAMFIKRATV